MRHAGGRAPQVALVPAVPILVSALLHYLIATALGGEAIPPFTCNGAETTMNS
jgi:hypothetical protein